MHKANPLSHWCDDLLRVLVLIAFVFFCVCLYACMCVVESECLRLCVLICVWFVRLARGERRQSPVIGEMERTHIPLISRSCKRSSRVKFYQTFVIAICQWQNFIVCHFLSTFFCDCHLSFANDHLVYVLTDCLWLLFVICKRPSCVKLYQTFFLSDYFCHFVLYFIQFSWLLVVPWPRFDLTGIPTIRGAIVRFWGEIFRWCVIITLIFGALGILALCWNVESKTIL